MLREFDDGYLKISPLRIPSLIRRVRYQRSAESMTTASEISTLEEEGRMFYTYPLSYGVPVRERYGSTLLPATRQQHDQNCIQSH